MRPERTPDGETMAGGIGWPDHQSPIRIITVENGPTLGDDPVFLRWCRECPAEWAAWQAQWAAELRKETPK